MHVRRLLEPLGAPMIKRVLLRVACAAAVACNFTRLALAWAIGFPALALLCIALVLCFVAVELLPKR